MAVRADVIMLQWALRSAADLPSGRGWRTFNMAEQLHLHINQTFSMSWIVRASCAPCGGSVALQPTSRNNTAGWGGVGQDPLAHNPPSFKPLSMAWGGWPLFRASGAASRLLSLPVARSDPSTDGILLSAVPIAPRPQHLFHSRRSEPVSSTTH